MKQVLVKWGWTESKRTAILGCPNIQQGLFNGEKNSTANSQKML